MWHGNWNEVQADEEIFLPVPGGYTAVICGVRDDEQKEYLEIRWDFLDRPYMGANKATYQRFGWWPTKLYRSYKEKARGMFKAFFTAVEESNPGYKFDDYNPSGLIGKKLGIVLREEEYWKNDGSVGKRLAVSAVKTVQQIADGDYKVLPLKKLDTGSNPGAVSDDFRQLDHDGDPPF